MKIDYNVENIFPVPIHIIDIDNFSSLQKKLRMVLCSTLNNPYEINFYS